MPAKPQIAIVGPGRLGSALSIALTKVGYRVNEVIARETLSSQNRAREIAKSAQSFTTTLKTANLDSDVIWFCVPDREIAVAARALIRSSKWKGKVAFHSSGALASDELNVLRRRGAAVASVHPMMTFVRGSIPSLKGVAFALEGDAKAIRVARRVTRDLGGEAFSISKSSKIAYHAWGGFSSPLLVAMLVTAEQVARAAGLSTTQARKIMLPIVTQTLANYSALGPAGAFSGPIVRGDVSIVRQHLRTLQKIPRAKEVYMALARAALQYLPARNRKELTKLLGR
ncbi:MAG TPA: Rossmann-like and DUF2520 domain-containing protein [Terriglobales bacterium]|nr:Rossmann-like and DUF2520 domain-containing protein [Terriglobales bacterium]